MFLVICFFFVWLVVYKCVIFLRSFILWPCTDGWMVKKKLNYWASVVTEVTGFSNNLQNTKICCCRRRMTRWLMWCRYEFCHIVDRNMRNDLRFIEPSSFLEPSTVSIVGTFVCPFWRPPTYKFCGRIGQIAQNN